MNRHERRRQEKLSGVTDQAGLLAAGFQRYRAGDLASAEIVYSQVLSKEPNNAEALRLLGELLADKGQLNDSLAMMQRLVALRPKDAIAQYSIANVYRMAGQIAAAMACYRASLAANPGFAGALHGLGACYRAEQKEREAALCFGQAAQAQPDWAVPWKDLGVTLAMLGDLTAAEDALERAVQLDPGLGDARRHLAAIRREKSGAEEIAALRLKCAEPRLPPPAKMEMLFALAGLEDKTGQYEAAFTHAAEANAMLRAMQIRAGQRFDRERLSRDVDKLIAAFPPAAFEHVAGLGEATEAPVFIVGMPRAGSTLFEQIAASHSAVFGAGERFEMGRPGKMLGQMPNARWTAEALREAGAGYLAPLRALAGDKARILDKMPDNIFNLGLIAAILPQARVIFCARDARDVAISCFFQNFAQPVAFDTDLADCAFRGREIARLTAHWQNVLPLRWMTLSYEDLLANPEAESRRLIEFLGLEWESSCLDFHRTERAVRTASWAQVRQPLYQGSVGRWRNYENQMQGIAF